MGDSSSENGDETGDVVSPSSSTLGDTIIQLLNKEIEEIKKLNSTTENDQSSSIKEIVINYNGQVSQILQPTNTDAYSNSNEDEDVEEYAEFYMGSGHFKRYKKSRKRGPRAKKTLSKPFSKTSKRL